MEDILDLDPDLFVKEEGREVGREEESKRNLRWYDHAAPCSNGTKHIKNTASL